jgi:hypothetical protein
MSEHPYWAEEGEAEPVPLAGEQADPPPSSAAPAPLARSLDLLALRQRLPTTVHGWLLALGAMPAAAILVLVVVATFDGHGSRGPAPSGPRAERAQAPRRATPESGRKTPSAPRPQPSRAAHRRHRSTPSPARNSPSPPQPQPVATSAPPAPAQSYAPPPPSPGPTATSQPATTADAAPPTTNQAATTTTSRKQQGGGCPPPVGYEC